MDKQNVILDKSVFVDKFLNPLSRLSERAVISFATGKIYSSVTSSDKSINSHICINSDVNINTNLNINNLKKFGSLLKYIPDNEFELSIYNNHLKYIGDNIRFTYHFLDDGIIRPPAINFDKVKEYPTDVSFELSADKILDLVKLSVISTDTKQKVYLSLNKDGVYAELTDKTKDNCDSVSKKICDTYNGSEVTSIPFSFEFFQILAQLKIDFIFTYRIDLGVVIVKSTVDNIEYILVSSCLVN
jgi:hypothetical protein